MKLEDIKFRGMQVNSYEWIYGFAVKDEHGFSILRQNPIDGSLERLSVEPDTIGMFSGLKDKDHREIFEGDILKIETRLDKAKSVVIFEEGEFRQILVEKYANREKLTGYFSIKNFEKEVIGNVHDNPELLEADYV